MKNSPDKKTIKTKVEHINVSREYENQRIDNYLINKFKGMPKTRVYRLLRKGEVRVNKKRVQPMYRLQAGDEIRLPPVVLEEKAKQAPPSKQTTARLADRIIYEDDDILIINKPSGMSVHAGSTVRVGVIEALRHLYPTLKHLELAHRLDAETSGCLVLAKKRRVLRELHDLFRNGSVSKIYWALTQGKWKRSELCVDLPLHKHYRHAGKHVVEVDDEGKSALTHFKPIKELSGAALMEVKLFTGRTHQIRVHASHRGHPIAMDDRYGDPAFNREARQRGLKRMFLHARSIEFILPSSGRRITVVAPLDIELENAIQAFER